MVKAEAARSTRPLALHSAAEERTVLCSNPSRDRFGHDLIVHADTLGRENDHHAQTTGTDCGCFVVQFVLAGPSNRITHTMAHVVHPCAHSAARSAWGSPPCKMRYVMFPSSRISTKASSHEMSRRWRTLLGYAGCLLIADVSLTACGATPDGESGSDTTTFEQPNVPGQPSTGGDGQAVDKIWQGINWTDNTILEITYPTGEYCSSVILTSSHLLTAGHCVNANVDTCGSYKCNTHTSLSVYRANSSGSKDFMGTFAVTTYRHSSYNVINGTPDPQYDIALVEFPSSWSFGTDYTRPIWDPLPKVGDQLEFYGWGTTSQFSDNGGQTLKAPPGDRVFAIDSVDSNNSYFIDKNDDDVRTCNGDSGAPALKNTGSGRRKIVGLMSASEKLSGKFCTTQSGQKQWWTRVADKMDWLEKRLINSNWWACPAGGYPCCIHDTSEIRCY